MERNYTWHDIVKRMEERRCPICRLIDDRTHQKISVLQYQHVSDVEFRKRFIDSKGFCEHHTEKFYEQGDSINHAIVYGHLLDVELRRLEDGSYSKKDKHTKPCMLCESENTSEAIYLNIFQKAFNEADFKTHYEDRGILCMHHHKIMLKRMKKAKNPDLKSYSSITGHKYQELLQDLKEIKRKNDFKHVNEKLTERETKAWQKARKLLVDQGEHRRK